MRRQQDLRGADRGRAQEHHARLVRPALLRLGIDDAHAGNAPLGVVVVEALDDRVGDDGQVAGVLRGRQRGGQRGEIRAVAAAAFAMRALLAGAAAQRDVLGRGFGEMRAASGRDAPRRKLPLDGFLERDFQAVQIHGRQEMPVGQLLEALVARPRCRRIAPPGRTRATDPRSGSASRRRGRPAGWR